MQLEDSKLQQRSIIAHIQHYDDEIKLIKKSLYRTQNENTTRKERIHWLNERLHLLTQSQRDLANLKRQITWTESIKGEDSNLNMVVLRQIESILNAQLYDRRFIDLFSNYLDKLIRESKGQPNRQGHYICPFFVVRVRPMIKNLKEPTAEIQIDETTTFEGIKEMLFEFWCLESLLKAPGDIIPQSELMKGLTIVEENQALIPVEESVLIFYRSRGQTNPGSHSLALAQSNYEREVLGGIERMSLRIFGGKGEAKLDLFQASKVLARHMNPYNEFLTIMEGLKYFINHREITSEYDRILFEAAQLEIAPQQQQVLNTVAAHAQPKNPYEHLYVVDDLHCCVLLWMVILLVLTSIQFSTFLSPTVAQSSNLALQEFLGLRNGQAFSEIETELDIWSFLNSYIAKGLLNSESKMNFFLDNHEIIGSIRLRSIRLKNRPCSTNLASNFSQTCQDLAFVSSHVIKTPILQNGNSEWNFYRTQEQAQTENPTSGIFGTYGGGGYVMDFSRDQYSEVFEKQVSMMQDYIDRLTKLVVIQFTTYTAQTNIWIYIQLMMERDLSFQFVPSKPEIYIFVPNHYHYQPSAFLIDMIRLTLAVVLLTFVAWRFCQQNYRIIYLTLEVGAMYLLTSLLTIISVTLTILHSQRNLDPKVLINKGTYIDLYPEATLYNLSYLTLSLTLAIIFLRIILLFKQIGEMKLIFLGWEKAKVQILTFILLVLPIMVAFNLMFMAILGKYDTRFTHFTPCLGQNIIMNLGGYNLELIIRSGTISVYIVIIFYLFTTYFVYFSFRGLLIESFRSSIMEIGYPKTEVTFSSQVILRWTFSWIYYWIDAYSTKNDIMLLDTMRTDNQQDERKLTENEFLQKSVF